MTSSNRRWNTCIKTLAQMFEVLFFFPDTACSRVQSKPLLFACLAVTIFIWMTLLNAAYQIMTRKGTKGFFVKMITAWSHFLNWPPLESFLCVHVCVLLLHWNTLILQEQYFYGSNNFLKVRTRQWEWENGLTKVHHDFCLSQAYCSGFISLAPTQFGN